VESGPTKVAETIAGWLLPPACREEILGDMRERYRSGPDYFFEALHLIPSMVYSRICRTTDPVVALMEGLSMFTAFVIAARCFDAVLIFARDGYARLALPAVVALAGMSLADAYSDPRRRWPLKPLLAPALGFAAAYVQQSMYRRWSLPANVMGWGTVVSYMLVSTIRLLFPPPAERPQAARIPASWQKLELAPLPRIPKSLLVPILLAVILYLAVLRG